MKKTLIMTCIAGLGYNATAQDVTIPDANFKAYLVGNIVINTNADTEIQVSEASAFAGTIDCSNLGISDLTGIEAFTLLGNLYCHDNQLTALDVSNNTALTYLVCFNNQLTALDVSSNSTLTNLYCHDNQLTALDVSNNTALTYLACFNNQLTTLVVRNNTELTFLNCANNQLTAIDVSNNRVLTNLWCNHNQLTALDVYNNTELTFLNCNNNQLTDLDLSNNSKLTFLNCANNQLTGLNVRNGSNSNFNTFVATINPNLTCIEVDNVSYSITNWTNIDSTAGFSENCSLISGIIPPHSDIPFVAYPNPVSNTLTIQGHVSFTRFQLVNTLGQVVEDNTMTNNQINVGHINKGIYTLGLTATDGKKITKLIVVE